MLLTWLLARLLTSACHVTQSTVMGADVALTWLSTWLLTSALTRPGQRVNPTRSTATGSWVNPTRSTVNRVTGQPDPANDQPGQPDPVTGHRSNGSTGSTRSTQPQPCARAATRCPTRRPFWWRVRAREREFLGNFGTYRFVSKFPTMWYIDLACLKLLKT